MNVVARGLMAAGMAVFAAMHVLQVLDPPAGAPAWLTVAFAAAALAGAVFAVMLVAAPRDRSFVWEASAAALAAASAVALALAFTVGFFGVAETELRYEVLLSIVAEVMVLGAFVVARVTPAALDEQTDDAVVGSPVGG